jgi:hypothetical protein
MFICFVTDLLFKTGTAIGTFYCPARFFDCQGHSAIGGSLNQILT